MTIRRILPFWFTAFAVGICLSRIYRQLICPGYGFIALHGKLFLILLPGAAAVFFLLLIKLRSQNSHAAIYGMLAALLCAGGFFITENKVATNNIIYLKEMDTVFSIEGADERKMQLSDALWGREIGGTGRIERISKGANSFTITLCSLNFWLSDQEASQYRMKAKLNLVIPEENLQLAAGQRICFAGELSQYDPATNPGQFDYQAYYESLGICGWVSGRGEDCKVVSVEEPLTFFLYKLRQGISGILRNIAEEEDYGILLCLLTGDKSTLTEELKELYQEGGIMHLLSLSGLHVSLVGTGLFLLLRKLTGSLAIGSLLSGSMVVLYGMLAMGGSSMRRAVLCYLFAVLGRVLGRQSDMLSAASLACILLLWEHPLLLFQSGFIMMLCCLIGIGYVVPVAANIFGSKGLAKEESRSIAGASGGKVRDGSDLWRTPQALLRDGLARAYKGLKLTFLTVVWLQISSMPAILWFQGRLPLFGTLVNLLTLPFMGLLLLSGLLAVAAYAFLPLLSEQAAVFLLGPAHYALSWYRFVLDRLSASGLTSVCTGRPRVWQLILFAAILTGFLSYSYSRLIWQHKRLKYIYGILAFPFCMLLLARCPQREWVISFLDVGQGDGIVMELPQKQGVICVDGGSSSNRKLAENVYEPYFALAGIEKVDCWILTHPDEDHYSALLKLLQDGFPVDHLMLTDCFRDSDLAGQLEALHRVEYLSCNDRIRLGKVTLEVLSPGEEASFSDTNDGSLVLYAGYGDFHVLLTGDASTATDPQVLKSLGGRGADVLKVSHHGSSTGSSEEFLKSVSPGLALVSAGKDNPYGHPHKEVTDRLEALSIPMLNTASSGCVQVFSNGRTSYVRTFV